MRYTVRQAWEEGVPVGENSMPAAVMATPAGRLPTRQGA